MFSSNATQVVASGGDPNFSSVSVLLHCDGTAGSTTFTDSSSNNHSIAVFGDSKVDTTVKKFGTGSCKFDGTGDSIALPSSTTFTMGTGAFTLEGWFYFATTPTSNIVYDLMNPTNPQSGFARLQWIIYGGAIEVNFFGTNIAKSAALSWTANTWYHIAAVRSGNSFTIYRDGGSVATGSNTVSFVDAAGYYIGRNVNGYVDDFRVTKGVARYTGTFTPPTAAFPDS